MVSKLPSKKSNRFGSEGEPTVGTKITAAWPRKVNWRLLRREAFLLLLPSSPSALLNPRAGLLDAVYFPRIC